MFALLLILSIFSFLILSWGEGRWVDRELLSLSFKDPGVRIVLRKMPVTQR